MYLLVTYLANFYYFKNLLPFFFFLVTVLSFNALLEERPLAKLQICY